MMDYQSMLGNLISMYAQQRFPQFRPGQSLPNGNSSQSLAGQNNAPYGQGQGANGIYGSFGAVLGGDPATSTRATLPSTQQSPSPTAVTNNHMQAPIVPSGPTAPIPSQPTQVQTQPVAQRPATVGGPTPPPSTVAPGTVGGGLNNAPTNGLASGGVMAILQGLFGGGG